MSFSSKDILHEWHGGVCSVCGAGKGPICAHHRVPVHSHKVPSEITNEVDLRRELELCVPVCTSCHQKVHLGRLSVA